VISCAVARIVTSGPGLYAQAANPPAQLLADQTFEGILGVVWGDPHPLASTSDIQYTLTLADGGRVRLQLTGQESEAAFYFGKRVIVAGRAAQAQAAALAVISDTPSVLVDSLTPIQAPQADAFEAVALGSKKVIFLLVKFPDDAAVPHPPSFYTDMTNPDTPPGGALFPSTINGFFKKTSYNQFFWTGDVGGVGGVGASGGWLTLPHPRSYYASCGGNSSCALLQALADDATALGRAQGINFKVYNNINFVLSNDLDCCAWGGGYYSSVDGQSYGATWEPPWGQNVPTYAHEMGHSLGLPHSGWVYYSYDSPWDVMSSVASINQITCGSYSSANGFGNTLRCSEPGDGYIAAYRDFLGWIPSANQVVTDTNSNVTVSLEAGTLPLGSAIKSIKVCIAGTPCTGSAAHYYTVEARVKGLGATSQYDNGIPGDGIIIHDIQMNRPAISGSCYFNNQSGWAMPIDATPGDYNSASCSSTGGLSNAQWVPGQTYTNGVKIAVLSRTGSTYLVSVTSLKSVSADFDSDGKADLTLYRPSTGVWWISQSTSNYTTYVSRTWGASTDIAVPGDYDGDGKADVAIFRPSTGAWWILKSSTNYTGYLLQTWGIATDIPVPGDYDGDGKTDMAIFRPATGTWWILQSSSNYTAWLSRQWGASADIPVPADYDGDGKMDVAIFRPSTGTWWILQSSTNYTTYVSHSWGANTDIPVHGDYDGDGKTDVAIFRPATGTWWILQSSSNYTTWLAQQWGAGDDTPVPADYDGDGKTDLAIFRPSTGTWWILQSSSNYTTWISQQWGESTDIPVPKRP